jgi:hypothetical protein
LFEIVPICSWDVPSCLITIRSKTSKVCM